MVAAMAVSQPVGCGQSQRLQPVRYHPLPLLLGGVRCGCGLRDHLANVLCLHSIEISSCQPAKGI